MFKKLHVLAQETETIKQLNLLLTRRNLGLGWKKRTTDGACLDLCDCTVV